MPERRCKLMIGCADHIRRRVAYRLVQRHFRDEPALYAHFPPGGVLELAERFRVIYPHLYPELAWYARNMAAGFKLKQLRDSGWEYANRALTKRKPAPPRRYD